MQVTTVGTDMDALPLGHARIVHGMRLYWDTTGISEGEAAPPASDISFVDLAHLRVQEVGVFAWLRWLCGGCCVWGGRSGSILCVGAVLAGVVSLQLGWSCGGFAHRRQTERC